MLDHVGLMKGSVMLDSRWEMCNSLRSLLALASRGSARLVPAILAKYPEAFGQAQSYDSRVGGMRYTFVGNKTISIRRRRQAF